MSKPDLRVIEGGARGDENGKAVHALYMWKVQSPHRRIVIELNAIATAGCEPAVKVTLLGTAGDDYEGYGEGFAEAVADALSKNGSGR